MKDNLIGQMLTKVLIVHHLFAYNRI